MSFIVEYLRKATHAPYGEVLTAAKESGHTIYPVMYGRAKAILGLIPVKKRGTGPTATATAAAAAGPGSRSRRGGKTVLKLDSLADLKGFLDRFKRLQGERDSYREALEGIAAAAKRALG